MLKREEAHVVVLGAGFGGLTATRALNVPGVRVTLVDRSNHHLFQPLLYQVATAALAAPDVSAPIRKLLWRQQNCTVLMAGVQRIEVEKRRVLLEGRHLDYDYLILATGVTSAYFGQDRWAAHAPGLKTIGDALDVRRRILRAFEAAELETGPEARRAWTTFVVIGGGPTGVELAGALAEIAGRTLARDFRHFDPRTTRVILIEAGPRLLSTFPEPLSAKARQQLENLGIEVRTGAAVTDLGPDFVELGNESIATRTVLWAAGVKASPLTTHLGVPMDRAGRIWVEEDLSVPGSPGGVRDRRSHRQDTERAAAAGRGAAGRAERTARRQERDAQRARADARTVPLRRQRIDGDHRPAQSGGAAGAVPLLRRGRLVALADRALAVAGRLPQPTVGAD